MRGRRPWYPDALGAVEDQGPRVKETSTRREQQASATSARRRDDIHRWFHIAAPPPPRCLAVAGRGGWAAWGAQGRVSASHT